MKITDRRSSTSENGGVTVDQAGTGYKDIMLRQATMKNIVELLEGFDMIVEAHPTAVSADVFVAIGMLIGEHLTKNKNLAPTVFMRGLTVLVSEGLEKYAKDAAERAAQAAAQPVPPAAELPDAQ